MVPQVSPKFAFSPLSLKHVVLVPQVYTVCTVSPSTLKMTWNWVNPVNLSYVALTPLNTMTWHLIFNLTGYLINKMKNKEKNKSARSSVAHSEFMDNGEQEFGDDDEGKQEYKACGPMNFCSDLDQPRNKQSEQNLEKLRSNFIFFLPAPAAVAVNGETMNGDQWSSSRPGNKR